MTFAGKARITTTTRPFFGLADKGRKTSRGHKWVRFLVANKSLFWMTNNLSSEIQVEFSLDFIIVSSFNKLVAKILSYSEHNPFMPKYMGMRLRFKEQRPSFHTADHGKVQARLLLKKFSSSERPSSICGSSGRSAAVRCLASAIAKDGRKSWMRSTPIMHWCCQRMSNSSLLLRSYYVPLRSLCSSLN